MDVKDDVIKKTRKKRTKKVYTFDEPLSKMVSGVHIYIEKSKIDYCMADKFMINNEPASILDFGISKDTAKDKAPSCGCGCREFICVAPSIMILEKYKISREQASEICKELKKYLYVGYCKKCNF